MKILYVARFHHGRAEVFRAKTLEELGNELVTFNMYKYEKVGGRYVNWILRKTTIPNPSCNIMNSHLLQVAINSKPDVVWIDKGTYVKPSTLKKIKAHIGALIISEVPDNMFIKGNRTRHYLSSIHEYDLIVTDRKRDDILENYSKYGVRELCIIHKGFYPIHHPIDLTVEEKEMYETDLVFCGTPAEDRANSLAFLAQNGIRMKIWWDSRHWKRMKAYPILEPFHTRRAVWWEEYTKAVNGAKIAMCFLKHISGDFSTQRSFELPACGTLTVSERTEDHLKLFDEDKEMIYFSDNNELLEKVRFYLHHEKEREKIAKAGRQRCINSDYTQARRYREVLSRIAQLRHETRSIAL